MEYLEVYKENDQLLYQLEIRRLDIEQAILDNGYQSCLFSEESEDEKYYIDQLLKRMRRQIHDLLNKAEAKYLTDYRSIEC